MKYLELIDLQKNARFSVPLFMYLFGALVTLAVRRDLGHFFSRELPRFGSEFCKIACALLLGAIALGLKSEPLRNSWLGTRSDADVVASMLLMLFVLLFYIAYTCFCAIEGRAIWREGREVGRWTKYVANFAACQACGVITLLVAVRSLRGN